MIAIITDIHFGYKNNHKQRFEETMSFFGQQFFPYIYQNKIKHVLCAGDIFDSRTTIDWWILDQLKERFFKWFDEHDVKLHIAIGNHDVYRKDAIDTNAFNHILNDNPNCIAYSSISTIEIGKYIIGMIPWQVKPKETVFPIADILVTHSELKGFSFTKGIESKEGYTEEDFKDYKLILNGHMHIKSTKGKLVNIGNPFQKDWGDFNEDKGFYVLGDNFDLTFIHNEICPKHVKILYDNLTGHYTAYGYKEHELDITEKTAIEIAKNNYVKLIYKGGMTKGLDKLHQAMLLVSKNNEKIELIDASEVVEICDSKELEENIKQDASPIKVIDSYVDSLILVDGIDKEKLNECMETLYKEVSVYEI